MKRVKSILYVGLKSLFVFVVVLSSVTLYLTCQDKPCCQEGAAKLCICVSAMDEPCKIDNKHPWYITIFNCDGTVLEYCGRRYILMPASSGCLEVAVPPGCYYIKAVWGFWMVRPGIYRVNHFTDAAIVQAVCNTTSCVRLFNPSLHRCGYIYGLAVNDLLKQKAIKAEIGKQVTGAIDAVNKQFPAPENKFELGIEQEINELMKVQEKENKQE